MKKKVTFILAAVLFVCFNTNIIFASWSYSNYQYLDSKAFRVYAEIDNYSAYSYAESIYDGTNVQIYIKNTTTYGPNKVLMDSHTIGYEGGTIGARVAPGKGFYLFKCVANGNVKNQNGDTVILTTYVED